MNRSVCAIVLILAAGAAYGANDGTPAQPVAHPVVASATTAGESSTTPPAADKPVEPAAVVVRHDQAPTDARDGRVQIGNIRISMASWVAPVPAARTTETPATQPATTEPAIEVPANTLGPGEAMWRVHDRQDAERKIIEAQADQERAAADYAQNNVHEEPSYTYFGGSAFSPIWGARTYGLHGPVTTTVTRFDDLGSTAQHAYFDAAYPRLNGTQDAHDRAVSRFGKDATPPIARIQNSIDRAHTNAFKEHPGRPAK